MGRYIGLDIGAETIQVAEVLCEGDSLQWGRRLLATHHKAPEQTLLTLLSVLDWEDVDGVAVCGRLSRSLQVPRVPQKEARAAGWRFLHPTPDPVTLVSIGSHGFSVLELREGGPSVFRENSRCSQGTGNFLQQLVERFDLDVEEASALVEGVEEPAPLSGRCPVILKTDMTHLANHGLQTPRILAGLYDAVAENAQVLVKPNVSPKRLVLLGGVSRSARIRDHFRQFSERHDLRLLDYDEEEAVFVDALGCAVIAVDQAVRPPALDELFSHEESRTLEEVPPLSASLDSVRRMPAPTDAVDDHPRRLVLGLDIGSTGSKIVALDATTREPVWQSYTATRGKPVEAAGDLVRDFTTSSWSHHPVVGFGATGSGREIVGSLLFTCFGYETTWVLNEIAAHAHGALHYDPRVDTIFEIGGQDAKYIRLSERPALLGVYGRDHRRGGRGRPCPGHHRRWHLRLDHPELPQPGEGKPIGR